VTCSSIRFLAAFALTLVSATATFAQAPSTSSGQGEDDAVLKLAEPDFTLIGLPTSLRLPKFKGAFRVTHRFTRPIDCDTCSNSFVADGFGTDGGAVIGLEYRFAIVPNGEVGVHRTADKTVELFGQYGLLRQGADAPVEASALAAVDVNNVGRSGADSNYSPALGVIVSRLIGDQAAVYVEPIWVHHTNLFEQKTVANNDTFLVGLGARVRVLPTVYLLGEFSPRVSGYEPGVNQGSFGVEKRLGGHMFQLNFSNSFGTTLGQIARGAAKEVRSNGTTKQNWYVGFNITRKFF
jgi:hypothetical protein